MRERPRHHILLAAALLALTGCKSGGEGAAPRAGGSNDASAAADAAAAAAAGGVGECASGTPKVSSDRWKEVLFQGAKPERRKHARLLHEIALPPVGKLPPRVLAIGELPEDDKPDAVKLADPNCRGEWKVVMAVASCSTARALRIGRAEGRGLMLAGLDGTPRLIEIGPALQAVEIRTTVRAECKPTRHLTDVTFVAVDLDSARVIFSDQIDQLEDLTAEGQERKGRKRAIELKDLDGDGIREIVITGEEEVCENAEAVRLKRCVKRPIKKAVWKLRGELFAEETGISFERRPDGGTGAKAMPAKNGKGR